jgi:hypothetical protein
MPAALEKKIRECHNTSCDLIERKNKPSMQMPKPKNMTRWSSGFCKICGEHMECITHSHAEKHGYKSAENLIADGMIHFD